MSRFLKGGTMKNIKELFALDVYRASSEEIHENILSGIDVKGGNLIILFCAIFIASLGLNVNSTAVIIGAMLISPLMGPIIAIGYGIGTHDFEIIKKSIKVLAIEIVISLITSIVYFAITPLKEAGSEIMARTSPTIWDVLIAFIGGLAGIIGATRKEKTNVIPGVAIATALMPPLCTAGFGIATLQPSIFFGAFYLFLINSVFISLSTFFVTKLLRLPIKTYIDKKTQEKMRKSILAIVVLTVFPSIFIAYNIVNENIVSANINKFIKGEFTNSKTRVIDKYYDSKNKKLELILLGENISKDVEKFLQDKMKDYGLLNVTLYLNQGVSATSSLEEIDKVKNSFLIEIQKKEQILREIQDEKIKALEKKVQSNMEKLQSTNKNINKWTFSIDEVKIIFPNISDIGLNKLTFESDGTEVVVALVEVKNRLTSAEIAKLESWLKMKTGAKDVYIYNKKNKLN